MNFIIMIVTPTQYIREAAHMVKTKYTPVQMSTARTRHDMSTKLNHSHLLHILVVSKKFISKRNYVRENSSVDTFLATKIVYSNQSHLPTHTSFVLFLIRVQHPAMDFYMFYSLFPEKTHYRALFIDGSIAECNVHTSDLVGMIRVATYPSSYDHFYKDFQIHYLLNL